MNATKRKLEEMTEERDALREKLDKLKAEVGSQRTGIVKQYCETTGQMVKNWVQSTMWRTCKFIDNQGHLEIMVGKSFDCLFPTLHDSDPTRRREARDSHILGYSLTLAQCLNDKRSYVQAETKKDFWAWMRNPPTLEINNQCDDQGNQTRKVPEPVPTPNEILMCAMRRVISSETMEEANEKDPRKKADLTLAREKKNQRMMLVFKWYCNCLLLRQIGVQQFGENVRCYHLLSKAPNRLSKKKENKEKIVTSATEAMTVLCYENCYDKWNKLWKFEQENGATVAERRARKTEEKPYRDKNDPRKQLYMAKWSKPDGGKKDIDGWTKKGKQQFVKYRKEINA